MPTNSSDIHNASDDNTDWRGQPIEDSSEKEATEETPDLPKGGKIANTSSGLGLTDAD